MLFQKTIAILALGFGLNAGAQAPAYTATTSTPVHFIIIAARADVPHQRPVQGRVVTVDGAPLANASVSLLADGTNEVVSATRTDSSGSYKVDIPVGGRYVLRIRSLGYTPVSIPVDVNDVDEVSSDITMHPFSVPNTVASAQP